MNNHYVIITCPFCEDLIEANDDEAIVRIQTRGCDNCLDVLDPSNIPGKARYQNSGSDNGANWNNTMRAGID